MTLLITGAAGAIGTALAAALAARGLALRLLDNRPIPSPPPGTEVVHADLRDLPALETATAGVHAVIHLAALTREGRFADMVEHNITGSHHVLEAARRQHVPRVVLASSHHVTGLDPVGTSTPLAPDSFYAVSKITAEALGHLYAHKTDIRVVIVRIGSYRTHPTEPRHRATWLSPRDTTALLHAAATRPIPRRILTIHATSDNPHTWWSRTEWNTLDYHPADNAVHHPDPGPLTDHHTGGSFADAELPS